MSVPERQTEYKVADQFSFAHTVSRNTSESKDISTTLEDHRARVAGVVKAIFGNLDKKASESVDFPGSIYTYLRSLENRSAAATYHELSSGTKSKKGILSWRKSHVSPKSPHDILTPFIKRDIAGHVWFELSRKLPGEQHLEYTVFPQHRVSFAIQTPTTHLEFTAGPNGGLPEFDYNHIKRQELDPSTGQVVKETEVHTFMPHFKLDKGKETMEEVPMFVVERAGDITVGMNYVQPDALGNVVLQDKQRTGVTFSDRQRFYDQLKKIDSGELDDITSDPNSTTFSGVYDAQKNMIVWDKSYGALTDTSPVQVFDHAANTLRISYAFNGRISEVCFPINDNIYERIRNVGADIDGFTNSSKSVDRDELQNSTSKIFHLS